MSDKEPEQMSKEDAEKAAQDPNHPAHPEHPKHHEWLKSVPKQLGGAAIFGAGASAGADLVQKALGG